MTRTELTRNDVPAPTETDRHSLLASESRRTTLRVLRDCDLPVGLDALAAAVVAEGTETLSAGCREIDRVAVRLHHVDLPKLARAGYVEYDTAGSRVVGLADVATLLSE